MTNKPPDKNAGKQPPDPKKKVQPPRGGDKAPNAARPGLATMPVAVGDDDEAAKPPENSIGIRLIAFTMALMCVCIGNYFVSTHPLMSFVYIFALVTGSYMSYINREAKTKWQTKVVIGGIILVAYNCWLELNSGLQAGDVSAFTPGIHFLAGTYVMQSFELRTRGEINTSTMLGLIILLLIAPISKSIVFGGTIFVYICLFVALLYFDCLNRTREGWEREPVQEVSLSAAQEKKNIFFKGNVFLCLSFFPLASLFLFLFLPRADDFVDNTYAYICSIYGQKSKAPVMMPDSLPENAKRWTAPTRKKQPNTSPIATPEKPKNGQKPNGNLDDDGRDHGERDKDDKDKSEKGESAKEGKGKAKAKAKSVGTSKDKGSGGSQPANAVANKEKEQKSAPKPKANPAKESAKEGGAGAGKSEKDGGDAMADDSELDIADGASVSNGLLFKVRSSRTCYMKTFGFDKYDEKGKWSMTAEDATPVPKNLQNGIKLTDIKPLLVPTNFPALQLTQDYVVERDLTRNVPAAWIPAKLDWKICDISVDEFGAIRLADDKILKKGNKFTVTSTFPVYDLPQMRAEQPLDQAAADDLRFRLSRYLQLPKELPDAVLDLSEKVTTGGGNWFVKTELATDYLRRNYKYSYTKNHGDSEDPLMAFLSEDPEKKGDCKDFATALVLLVRAAGVPARIACGYSPGELNPVSGYREVKFKNSHCWAEVYIPEHGWVPFDATPNGYMPDKPHEQAYDLDSLKKTSKKDLEQLENRYQDENQKKPKITWQQVCMLLSAIGVSGVCLFFLVRTILKALKNAKKDKPIHHPAKKYLKLVEADLKKWKIERLPQETGLEYARRVKLVAREKSRLGQAVDKDIHLVVESFMDNYEAAFYGNKERLQDLETLAKRIKEAVGKGGAGGGGAGSGGTVAGKEPAATGGRPQRPGKPGK